MTGIHPPGAIRIPVLILAAALLGAPGCLVLSVQPAYEEDAIVFEPTLVGKWQNVDDNATVEIERGEWRSYKLHYEHPIEKGDLTGYLTSIGEERYLDVMPARGEDRGSFLIPVHALLRVRLQGDKLELTPLSYDWFFDRVRSGTAVQTLTLTQDQKENVLITSLPARLRAWLRQQPLEGPMFGAPATFVRK